MGPQRHRGGGGRVPGLSTGEQTVNSFSGGSQGPALFLAGSGAQVFNGPNAVGGFEGVFDQSLALGADLAGLL